MLVRASVIIEHIHARMLIEDAARGARAVEVSSGQVIGGLPSMHGPNPGELPRHSDPDGALIELDAHEAPWFSSCVGHLEWLLYVVLLAMAAWSREALSSQSPG
ncbi:MAG: hypothetical protein K0V04_03420 [Deltaproteobacteria bacterium]|nr:hypothetical protein [Deltaproteobacteria bacterium]